MNISEGLSLKKHTGHIAASVTYHQYSKTRKKKSDGAPFTSQQSRRQHTWRRSVGSCLPCRPDNNPSETRTRFLPGLKNSCDKLSVLLGSTLYQKPMNILPAGGEGWMEGGGEDFISAPPPRLLGRRFPRSVACTARPDSLHARLPK